VGRRNVRAGDMDMWRRLTCNSSQDDATVKCWGDNSDGQLGYGDELDRGDGSNGYPQPSTLNPTGVPRS